MENLAILYTSKYGNTQKYAQLLNQELQTKVNLLNADIQDYQNVIILTSVYAGKLYDGDKILNIIKNNLDKKFFIITVGMSDVSNDKVLTLRKEVIEQTLGHDIATKITSYHLSGGINFKNLKFKDKMLLKVLHRGLKSRPQDQRSSTEQSFIDNYGQSFEVLDEQRLQTIVQAIKNELI